MSMPAVQAGKTSMLDGLRAEARAAPESGIVEVMNYGRRRGGVMPLWAGEGDLPTPPFIAEAATRALAAGETFYTWQRGIPELREALARYHSRLYGREFSSDEFFVTGSGMQAIQIALAMTAGVGDEVLIHAHLAERCGRRGRDRRTAGRGAHEPRQCRLEPRSRSARTRGRPARARPLPSVAVESDGVDRRPRGIERPAGTRAPPRPVDHRRRNLRPVLVRRRRAGAVLHRRNGERGPHPVRQHVLQELGDDRLARRLDHDPSRAGAGGRESDPVLDLRRRAVHATCRRDRART